MLELVHALDILCWNAGFDMFIIGGTLIGQVFYHGFVPWDDDMDVAVHVKDRKRLQHELDVLAKASHFEWSKWPKRPSALFKFFHKGVVTFPNLE